MGSVRYGSASDVGMVRDHNEDNLVADQEQGLWLVADGMGGYEAGEVASGLVAEHVPRLLRKGMGLQAALEQTNALIHQSIDEGKGARGMGTTVVAMHMQEGRYEICWIGDSRAYLWDGFSLIQLTRDHSLVQQLLDSGVINAEEALHHPQRNVISQAMGGGSRQARIDRVSGQMLRGYRILLCSDGLSSELSDEEIAAILAMEHSCQESADLLVEAANNHGGQDNITIILVDAPPDAPSRLDKRATRPMRTIGHVKGGGGRSRLLIAFALPVGALLLVLAGWWLFSGGQEESQVSGGGSVNIVQGVKRPVPQEEKNVFIPSGQGSSGQTVRLSEMAADGGRAVMVVPDLPQNTTGSEAIEPSANQQHDGVPQTDSDIDPDDRDTILGQLITEGQSSADQLELDGESQLSITNEEIKSSGEPSHADSSEPRAASTVE